MQTAEKHMKKCNKNFRQVDAFVSVCRIFLQKVNGVMLVLCNIYVTICGHLLKYQRFLGKIKLIYITQLQQKIRTFATGRELFEHDAYER